MTIKKLLHSLQEHNVRFLVIGAWALPAHGYVRNTGDIDFFIEPTKRNAKRTKEAANRDRDKLDLIELYKIRESKNKVKVP
ncbi:MAG: hypothetical protein EPO24_07430 [Bacteroidetes bacterium]|nr:MAG: hypothetical protein EPO24_07430 [Bacteroidota bacterium]